MNKLSTYVVYTAVFGDYDNVSPVKPEWKCDFICFTDNPNLVSNGWKIIHINLDEHSPAYLNRKYKILPHKYLSSYDYSLYIDGNIVLKQDPTILFEKYLKDKIMAIAKHPTRCCIYEEARSCINLGLSDQNETTQQMEKYLKEGFPRNYGLTVNNIIFRSHKKETTIKLMDDWWHEFNHGGKRDQLSLSYLLWKNKLTIGVIDELAWKKNKFFSVKSHNKKAAKLNKLLYYFYDNRYENFFYEKIFLFIKSLQVKK